MASKIKWDIRLEGRAWKENEIRERLDLIPEKFEIYRGKLFWNEKDRLSLLAMLLENVGVRKVVRLGNTQIWPEAIGELENTGAE